MYDIIAVTSTSRFSHPILRILARRDLNIAYKCQSLCATRICMMATLRRDTEIPVKGHGDAISSCSTFPDSCLPTSVNDPYSRVAVDLRNQILEFFFTCHISILVNL